MPLVHACCPNNDCHHIFHATTDLPSFTDLPSHCPKCLQPLSDAASGKLTALGFPCMPVEAELERILAIPGIETALDNLDERIVSDAQKDAVYGETIYRKHYHGLAFKRSRSLSANMFSSSLDGKSILDVRLNISLDWFNPNSGTMHQRTSIGPLLCQLSDLPQRLRGKEVLFTLLGITPGQHEPHTPNLWGFLVPLIMEIRRSWTTSLLVVTPRFPEGRFICLIPSVVCCDGPARTAIVGSAGMTSKEGFCTRCTAVKGSDLECKLMNLGFQYKLQC